MYVNKADATIYQQFITTVICRVYYRTFQIFLLKFFTKHVYLNFYVAL
jgi:hypothetical protein